MADVALDHVNMTYHTARGAVNAIRDLSLTVADGSFVVLVGPSGCGKTTTLRLIAGLERPSAGIIRIGNRTVNDIAPRDRDVAMVFQNYALYPHMTVYKNLAFGLKMRGTPKAEIDRRVLKTARLLGIETLLERKPASLSGGEQQRVALGRAAVRNPQVFLLDEPLSNLDATLRTRLRTELKALHQRLGVTIIHVTHDQQEAMTLGDRIAVMKDGVVHQFAAPLDIYDRPADRFVASFIGTPSINLFPGCLGHDDGRHRFTTKFVTVDCHFAITASDYDPNNVVLGVRPEDVHIEPADAGASRAPPEVQGHRASIPTTVRFIETLGDCTLVHLATPCGAPIVARCDATVSLNPGQRLAVSLDTTRAHLFAGDEPGRRLSGDR